MNILILGATGFIGNNIFLSLVTKYKVTIASRYRIESYQNWKKVDFLKNNDWDNLLDGIDLVINAIGIIKGNFERVQTETPIDLYKICISREIKIIHISAIGAEEEHPLTNFLKTKKATDDFLLKYNQSKIIYPGIVIGKNGKSTQFFTEIAQLPIIPLISEKPISFIHINQLTKLIQKIIVDFSAYPKQIFAVSKPEPLKDVFSALKGRKGKFIIIPKVILHLIFLIFPKASIGIFDKSTFKMFLNTSVKNYTPMFPKVSKSIDSNNIISGNSLFQIAILLILSFIWIWSGISSLISWDRSYSLMSEIGANHLFSVLFIWLGSIVDIFLGLAIFSKKYRKRTTILQIITMLAYMLILSIGAPNYWLHPFGVLTKNIPLIALSYYFYKNN
jgi:nucleoside-diphosphate-sugar epimerase